MEKLFFASDYQEGAHPSILKRLEENESDEGRGERRMSIKKIAVRKLEVLTAIFLYAIHRPCFPLCFSRAEALKSSETCCP